MGGNVYFVGCVGGDNYGKDACDLYDRMGISRQFLTVDPSTHSESASSSSTPTATT